MTELIEIKSCPTQCFVFPFLKRHVEPLLDTHLVLILCTCVDWVECGYGFYGCKSEVIALSSLAGIVVLQLDMTVAWMRGMRNVYADHYSSVQKYQTMLSSAPCILRTYTTVDVCAAATRCGASFCGLSGSSGKLGSSSYNTVSSHKLTSIQDHLQYTYNILHSVPR